MFESCTSDTDCVRNEVCFIANESWSNRSMCFCNTYYGFSGPNCEKTIEEPNGIFFFVDGVIGIIACSLFTCLTAWNLMLLCKATPRERKRTMCPDPVLLTTLYFTLGGLILIPYSSLLIAMSLSPFAPTLCTDESHMYIEFVAQNLLTVGLMFLAAGVMTVALGFIEMTVNISAFRRKLVRTVGLVFKILFFVVVITLVALRSVYLALLVSFPFVIILAGTYIAGLVLLTRKIHLYKDHNDKALQSLKGVQRTVFIVCLCLVAEIAIAAIGSITALAIGWRTVTPPGHLTIMITGHIIWIPSILSCLAVMNDITIWRKVRQRQYVRAAAATMSSPSINFAGGKNSSSLFGIPVTQNPMGDSISLVDNGLRKVPSTAGSGSSLTVTNKVVTTPKPPAAVGENNNNNVLEMAVV